MEYRITVVIWSISESGKKDWMWIRCGKVLKTEESVIISIIIWPKHLREW